MSRRHRAVLLLTILLGASAVGGAALLYNSHASFARRAVGTTAEVEEITQGVPSESRYGSSTTVYGTLRFVVDGTTRRARIPLWSCGARNCPNRFQIGDPVEIAYDPHDPDRVELMPITEGITRWVVVLFFVGVVALATVSVGLVWRAVSVWQDERDLRRLERPAR